MRKTNYEKILDEYESNNENNKQQIYHRWYNLKEVAKLKGMSYKTSKDRAPRLLEKYESDGTIYKQGKRYFISHRLLDQFQLKQKRKDSSRTIYNHPWKSNISWTTKDFYSKEYHVTIYDQLKVMVPGVSFIGCVELDEAGRNHVHLLSDEEPQRIEPILGSLMNDYLDNDSNYRLYCEEVFNTGESVDYLLKNPQIKLNNTELNF